MSIVLPEKLKLRTESLKELTHLELDQNQQFVANAWSPLRKYKEGMIVYVAEEDVSVTGAVTGFSAYRLSWWRANVDHGPDTTFDISKWNPIGAQSVTGEIAVKDDDIGLVPTAATLLDFGDNLEVTMVGNTARIDVTVGVSTPWTLVSGDSMIYYEDTVVIGDTVAVGGYQLEVVGHMRLTGNLVVAGLVDGVDITQLNTRYLSHNHYISNSADFSLTATPGTQLADVQIAGLADGHVLVYDSVAMKWKNEAAGIGAHGLDTHTDVNYVTGLSANQVLVYNGSKWVNVGVTTNPSTGLSTPFVHNHDSRYYTQTNLSTSGGSVVHWDNITGAPTSVPDDEPFLLATSPVGTPLTNYRVISSDSTISASDTGPTGNILLSVVDRESIQKVTIQENSVSRGNHSYLDFADSTTINWVMTQITGDDGIQIEANVIGLTDALNAIANAQFLTLAASSDLAVERVFTPGTALSAVDGGVGSTYTLNVVADSIRQLITTQLNGSTVGTSNPILNFIEGTDIDITVVDNSGVYDITINSTIDDTTMVQKAGVDAGTSKYNTLNFIDGTSGDCTVVTTVTEDVVNSRYNITLDVTAPVTSITHYGGIAETGVITIDYPVTSVAGKTGNVTLRLNSDLIDVLISPLDLNTGTVLAPASDGIYPNVLIWDGINNVWRNRPADELFAIASSLSLDSLIDVEVNTTGSPPADKQILYFDFATQLWVNGNAEDANLYTQSQLQAGALNTIYYTQTQLGSTGTASYVHWDKVYGYPTFALASQIKEYAYELLDVEDYSSSTPTAGQILSWNALGYWEVADNVANFLTLTDSPASYTGYGGYIVKVNSGETAVEFGTLAIEDLSDVLYNTGDPQNGNVLKYNSTSGKWEPATDSTSTPLSSILAVGNTTGGTNILFGTADARFGSSGSYINDNGSNGLKLYSADRIYIQSASNDIQIVSSSMYFNVGDIIFETNSTGINWNHSAQTGNLYAPTLTDNRTWALPDASGTIALDGVLNSIFTEITDGHLEYNGNTIAYLSDIEASDTFIELNDTPSSYSGQSLKFVRVNSGGTGLEFADAAASLADLTDVLLNTGEPQDGQILKYSTGEGAWVVEDSLDIYITDSTAIGLFTDESNWNGNTYTGSSISNVSEGQRYFDETTNTWYEWIDSQIRRHSSGAFNNEIQIGAINTGQSEVAGMIQWDGNNFLGYTGSEWKELDAEGNAIKQTVDITGDDINQNFVINHTLNTRDVIVQVYDANSPYDTQGVTVERTSTTSITVKFAAVVATGEDYRVVIIG